MRTKKKSDVTTPKDVTASNSSTVTTDGIKDERLKYEPYNVFTDAQSSANSAKSQKITPDVTGCNRLSSVISETVTKTKSRSAPITEADVAEAYMKYVSDGTTPTVRLIHDYLERGSNSTIQEFFKSIDHDYRQHQIEASELPNNLSDFENLMIKTISKACYVTKVKRYESRILTLNSVIERLEVTNTEEQTILCNELEALHKDLSAAQAVIETLNKEKSELQDRLTNALNENAKLKNAVKECKSDLKHYRELEQLITKSIQDPDLPKTLAKKIKEEQ